MASLSLREVIYLNNAATTFPKPDAVRNCVSDVLAQPPVIIGRCGGQPIHGYSIEGSRSAVARFFGTSNPAEISFSSGATASLNMIIMGLCRGSDHIVTTDTEHNSVLRPLYRLRTEENVRLSFARCDARGYVDPDEIDRLCTAGTRCVVVNHGSNVTGAVQDIREIARRCRERGILCIVDAAQTAGHIAVDISEVPVDALVFAGHKGLYGLPGTGGAFIRSELEIPPLAVGGSGTRSDLTGHPLEPPARYEAGTPNTVGICALEAGVTFVADHVGTKEERNRLDQLVQELADALCATDGVTVYCGRKEARTPVLSCTVDGIASEEVALILADSYGIIVRAGLHCAPRIHVSRGTYPDGAVRIALSHFTTGAEIDAIRDAIASISRVTAGGGNGVRGYGS